MRVFVAGATGAIGRQLVPRLVGAGHEVHGMTRYAANEGMLRQLGAVPVLADAFDADQVSKAVDIAQPHVIVHQLTALAGVGIRNASRGARLTNRLRTEGTDHLLSAGQEVGIQRFVAQSIASLYAPTGGPAKSEDEPLDAPPGKLGDSLAAIRHLEGATLDARWTKGIALRYGALYGPGTNIAPGGEMSEMIRKRRFPLVGTGSGIWSFVHIADAAEATLAAIEHGNRGVYNIVDDDPVPVAEWLPDLTRSLSGNRPRRMPRFLLRLAAGEAGVLMMTESRGASNAKAKRDLPWSLQYPSWRQGFAASVSEGAYLRTSPR